MLHHLDDNLSPFDNLSVLPSLPVKQLEIRLTVFVGHSEKKKKKNHVLDIYCYDVNIVLIGAGLTTCKFGCTFDSRALVRLL